jgi:hypothetical protein
MSTRQLTRACHAVIIYTGDAVRPRQQFGAAPAAVPPRLVIFVVLSELDVLEERFKLNLAIHNFKFSAATGLDYAKF